MLEKIVSGGQTGADRAALDFAIKHKIPHGGWIPKGRLAEDGPLPAKYKLTEMPTDSYQERTEQNVIDSDGTVIISRGKLTGGSAYILKMAKKHNRPYFHVDLKQYEVLPAALEILSWLGDNSIKSLNVAGPRASKDPKIYESVKEVLTGLWLLSSSRDQYLHSLKLTKSSKTAEIKRPETVDEAVDRLMSEMNLKDLTKLAKMPEDDLVTLHFTVGMWIRNNFVYPRNDKLLQSCREVSRDKYLHFAQLHMVVIRELWKKLQETHKLKVVR
jgi:hypothetical protein